MMEELRVDMRERTPEEPFFFDYGAVMILFMMIGFG
ncbi:hypothetical protein SAMN04487928_13720 [Butyrivibrio proteoclasticus]|uniref:Uncharacterized protein n=1 Tax=Butyrivibrio proteoclasticus TaxID=43305 RepID=A0A1I5XTN7_9FIRM|nr:hypothetical protein SAMN04487928_13720 [Butyrivibrio proteoclasticus]